jgi:hypothetical protein
VGFLRRVRGGSTRGTTDALRSSPDWAAALRPQDFEYLAWLVQKELGRSRIPDVEMLRDFANAAELSLVNLLPLLEKIPTDKWPQFIHVFFEGGRAHRAAGDAVEARAQTFEAAADVLRIHWMKKAGAPAGDVTIDGPIPDVVEVLALDAGDSMRHVSERLLARWGVTVAEAVRVARERVLTCPVVRTDLSEQGHPAVRVISLEHEGPWGGALLTGLDRLDPSAIGAFGTLVGAPVENALVYRALDASEGLRADLGHLSVFTFTFAEKQKEHGFLRFPLWRARDGRTRPVAFRFSDAGELLDSHDPGFAGVLAALDPQDLLPVPGWAHGILSRHAYTRFAGCVSAVRGFRPAEIGELGSALLLHPLARQCRAVGFDEWPALVEAHLAPIQATFDAANAMLREAGEDRDSRRAHLATWLVSGDDSREDWVTRPLGETGLFEILGFHASGTAVPVSAAAAATLGAPQELFELGEDAIRRALVVEPAGLELLSGEASLVTGLPSPTAAIPHLMTWLPDAVGPYGALVAVGDASRLVVLPIHDASAVLDLPALLGLAVGASMRAAWTIPPTVFWLVPDRLEVIHVVITDGVVTTATTTADLAALVARLPTAPQRLPAGLPAILGPEGSRRFYGLLHAAVVRRLTDDPAGLSELTLFLVRDLAGSVRDLPAADWAKAIDEIPVFAKVIEGIYREADEAADARSPWLFWLTPDGKLIELFDVLQPLPRPDGLPTEFRAVMDPGMRARLN